MSGIEALNTVRPRSPETTVLYQVVAEQLETFLSRQQERYRRVPQFVKKMWSSTFNECEVVSNVELTRGSLGNRASNGAQLHIILEVTVIEQATVNRRVILSP